MRGFTLCFTWNFSCGCNALRYRKNLNKSLNRRLNSDVSTLPVPEAKRGEEYHIRFLFFDEFKVPCSIERSLYFENGLQASVFLMSKDIVCFHTLRRIKAMSDHKIELHLSVDHGLSQLVHVVPGRTTARTVG